jgi:hypothetical protein
MVQEEHPRSILKNIRKRHNIIFNSPAVGQPNVVMPLTNMGALSMLCTTIFYNFKHGWESSNPPLSIMVLALRVLTQLNGINACVTSAKTP